MDVLGLYPQCLKSINLTCQALNSKQITEILPTSAPDSTVRTYENFDCFHEPSHFGFLVIHNDINSWLPQCIDLEFGVTSAHLALSRDVEMWADIITWRCCVVTNQTLKNANMTCTSFMCPETMLLSVVNRQSCLPHEQSLNNCHTIVWAIYGY